jgi:hypothetical protein
MDIAGQWQPEARPRAGDHDHHRVMLLAPAGARGPRPAGALRVTGSLSLRLRLKLPVPVPACSEWAHWHLLGHRRPSPRVQRQTRPAALSTHGHFASKIVLSSIKSRGSVCVRHHTYVYTESPVAASISDGSNLLDFQRRAECTTVAPGEQLQKRPQNEKRAGGS